MGEVYQVCLVVVDQSHGHGIETVYPAERALFLNAKEDLGNILEEHGPFPVDNYVADILYIGIFGCDIYEQLVLAVNNLPCKGLVPAVVIKYASDLAHRNPQRFAGFFIQPHLDRILIPAKHLHPGNSIDILEIGLYFPVCNIPYPVDTSRSPYLKFHELVRELLQVDLYHIDLEFRRDAGLYPVNLLLQLQICILQVGAFGIIDNYCTKP